MSYTSFSFILIFFSITYILHSLMPQRFKWMVLFTGSWAFYILSTKGHIIPLIITTVAIWLMGINIQRLSDEFKQKKKELDRTQRKALKQVYNKKKRIYVVLGILIPLALLLFLKYCNFFTGTVNSIFGTAIPELSLVHPMGLSFYTLQAISYIADVNSGKVRAEKNPFKVSLYLSFMLTVVEGPIARYNELGTQLVNSRRVEKKDFDYGVQLILIGLFKKVVVADRMSGFCDEIFGNYDSHLNDGGVLILIAVVFYTFQLYCEFSGITEVVTGMGRLMGIELPKNFEQPFFAVSINNFWQRWHISLGSWLRDYIFYPISLSKPFMKLSKSARKRFNQYYATLIPTATALFFVWFANGFWHGASWKYICYGLYYYVLMMMGMLLQPLFDKLHKALKINKASLPYKLFQIIRTDIIVGIGMFIFRAESLKAFVDMFKAIFTSFNISAALEQGGKYGVGIKDLFVLFVCAVFLFILSLLREKGFNLSQKLADLPTVIKFILHIGALMIIILIGAYGEGYGIKDLIYAGF